MFHPIRSLLSGISLLGSFALLQACMTSGDGADLKNQLFTLQKRTLELEHVLNRTGEESKTLGDEAKRKIASSSVRMDQFGSDIQKIKGDLDTLRIGVTTGEMPGMVGEQDSVAKSIRTLAQRVESLERTQAEMLAILEKVQGKVGKGNQQSSNSKDKGGLQGVGDVEKAFKRERYTEVIDQVPALLDKKKGQEKYELKYLYAESLYKKGRLHDAALAYNEIVGENTLRDRRAKMQTRLGDCFRHLGDNKAALIFYREAIRDFPQTQEAKWAKEQMEKLEAVN